ncbi:MAG: hypothetical protein WBR15_02925 [Gammaproteobacteria bacterium]
MSLELKDFRGKITVETDCALAAEAKISGHDRQEIARKILHKWALEKIHAATVMHRLLQAEGMPGIETDQKTISGNRRERTP